jgi:DNA-binding MarR family transcriptional regulator
MLVDAPAPYNLSFTAASLRPELARVVAEVYLAERDWDATRRRILDTNALQARSASSAKRLEIELRRRLVTLTDEQIALLTEAPAEDRAAMAWLGAIKRSRFLLEFAAELLRDKLAAHDPVLRRSDYEGFVEARSVAHPELTRLTPASRAKIRSVLLRMLTEAGLLRGGAELGAIQRPVLSPLVAGSIVADDPRWLAGFLVPETEIAAL